MFSRSTPYSLLPTSYSLLPTPYFLLPSLTTSRRSILVPKLVTSMKTYDRTQLARDMLAGVVVGVVALPLAIAFAIASGVTPDRGLWTAIVAGFIVAALGGSRVQIAGPTG